MPFINCPCGARIEGADGNAIADAFARHNAEVHADLKISERRLSDADAAIRRSGGWDGQRVELDADVQIRPLTPDLADAFLGYFDVEAFTDNPAWASCYCMTYHVRPSPGEEWEQRSAEVNRNDRRGLLESGEATGILAFSGERVVGWCNASPRNKLPLLDTLSGWESIDPERSGAIVCFAIAPPYRGQGVAKKLLDGACDYLRDLGLAYVEAYPPVSAQTDAAAYHGRLPMYLDAGFERVREAGRYVMVRKAL